MATVTLSNPPVYYSGGSSGASAAVGYANSKNRVARYTFTSPASGASHVDVVFLDPYLGGGSYPNLRFFIGTDPDSHANAGAGSTYTGDLTFSIETVFTYKGSADIMLLPNTAYYLWVFPADTTYGWWHWNGNAGKASMEVTGAAISVITGAGGTLSEENTLTLTRYSTSFTHTITAVCGSAAMTVASGVTADSVKWTPPVSWAAQNTTGTSVAVVVTCTTYSGSTAIGKTTVTLTFKIPTSVKPTVSLEISDAQGHLGTYGKYIQGKSRASVAVSAEGIYGSTIKTYAVICGSLLGNGASLIFDLPDSGTITIAAEVTDSRGRTAAASATIEVAAYAPPAATITGAYRCDAEGNENGDGNYGMAVFNAVVTPLDGRNSASYALKYRVRGKSTWTGIPVDALTGNFAPSGATQIFPADISSGYELSVEVTDNFGSVLSTYRTIQVSFAMADFDRSNKAIGFGQRATLPGKVGFGLPPYFSVGAATDFKMVDTEAALEEWLDSLISAMEDRTVKLVSFYCPPLGGAVFGGILFQSTAYYATLFAFDPGNNLGVKSRTTSGWSAWTLLHAGVETEIFAIDDGGGNVTIVAGDITASDDGEGNVTIKSDKVVAVDDGSGNITLNYV